MLCPSKGWRQECTINSTAQCPGQADAKQELLPPPVSTIYLLDVTTCDHISQLSVLVYYKQSKGGGGNSLGTNIPVHIQHRHTDRHTHRQTDTDTHTQTDRDRHTHTHTQTHRQTHRHTQTDRQTHRQTDRQTDRQTHTHMHTEITHPFGWKPLSKLSFQSYLRSSQLSALLKGSQDSHLKTKVVE